MGNPQVIIGETVAGRAATVRKQMARLSTDLQRNTFDIAALALEAQEHGYFRDWGYESFGEYGEQELGIRHRKLQYLARICKVMKICAIQRTDYEPAGVTKLRLITSLEPDSTYFNQETKQHEDMAEHITALVADSPELDTKEIEQRVAHLKGMDGPNAMVTKSYSVTQSCYENTIAPALEVMRRLLGSKGRDDTGSAVDYPPGTCIEYICREFLNDPNNFLEETDESQVQIEVPEEDNGRLHGVETDVRIQRSDGGSSADGRSNATYGVCRDSGAPLSMAEQEAIQNTLPSPGEVLPS